MFEFSMNFFQRKNKTLVSFEESDWKDINILKNHLNSILQQLTNEVRLDAKNIPSELDLKILGILLSFSVEAKNQGRQITWVFPKNSKDAINRMGLDKLLGKLEFFEV